MFRNISWRLKRDEIGVISVPSVQSVKTPEEETNRDVRMKRREVRIVNRGNVYETRQSSLLYVFVGFFGPNKNFKVLKCERMIDLFCLFSLSKKQRKKNELLAANN